MLLSPGAAGDSRVTPAEVRGRLAGAVHDPGAAPHPGGFAPLIPAAVLVPLVTHDDGMTAIFTQRTAHLSDHAGQVSFPGGRLEPEDPDAVAAALREAEEEVGLAPARVEVAGCLDVFDTSTGFAVTPVIGLIPPPVRLVPDPYEVAAAFEVPLGFLLDPANRRRERRLHRGRMREYYVYDDYRGFTIWGATAGMVVRLSEALAR